MRDYYSEKASDTDIEELREVCRPIIEYLHQKRTPYDKIIIDWSSAEILEGKAGVAFEVPD